jgi:hypothetical protein
MTNFSWCRQEVDGQHDLDGNFARLCATIHGASEP